LAALLLRIRSLKQVKYLDSLRFDTAFSTKDDFLRLSDLEEDTEDVELFNFFFRREQKSGDMKVLFELKSSSSLDMTIGNFWIAIH
jgi:hypothetical protein